MRVEYNPQTELYSVFIPVNEGTQIVKLLTRQELEQFITLSMTLIRTN